MAGNRERRRINPMQRPIPGGVFTDREDILSRLRRWVPSVKKRARGSRVLVGQRRVGKSAVLEQFYNELFWEEDMVAPFLFEIPGKPIWRRAFAVNYFTQVVLQFACFLTKDPTLIERSREEPPVSLEEVRTYAEAHGLNKIVSLIDRFTGAIGKVLDDFLEDAAFAAPQAVSSSMDKRMIVMLDEFQRLDEEILCVDEAAKRPLGGKRTGGFSILADSRTAPMLVCGSAVSFMTRKVISGGLNGRFRGVWRLGPMSVEDGAQLAVRLARDEDVEITLASAYKISQVTGGNPFYIETVLRSDMPSEDLDLTTDEGVEAVLSYETSPGGEIYEFWDSHFQANLRALGEDTGDDTAKRVLFAVLKWEQETSPEEQERLGGVRYRDIAQELGLDPQLVMQRLNLLVEADLLQPGWAYGFYLGLRDEMLRRMLSLAYENGTYAYGVKTEREASDWYSTSPSITSRSASERKSPSRAGSTTRPIKGVCNSSCCAMEPGPYKRSSLRRTSLQRRGRRPAT